MLGFVSAFFTSAVLTLLVLRSERVRAHRSSHGQPDGPQNFHFTPAPRIGGVGIFGSMALVVGALVWLGGSETAFMGMALALCGLPAFGAGLAEDITKRVAPAPRLIATVVSALLAAWALGATLNRTDLWGIDWFAATPVGATLLAVLVVSGVANAVNIIDGFNGLASMCVAMMLLAITYVANQVGDSTLAALALLGCGAVLGFFVWNFPAGLIFLGDGGAYFLGFYVAELGLLLITRNPGVSPLCPLLMCMYPIVETVFSIYRKRVLRGMSPGVPDGVHLHMLVYGRLMRWGLGARSAKELTRRNSMTSPYLWCLCGLAVVPSVLFWSNSLALGACIVLFGVVYVLLYWRIVRFRAPDWLVFRK